jgi:3-mercaptopyruvate sulfurtransferase SseA
MNGKHIKAACPSHEHVHPLSGGLEAWRDAGFVIDPVHAEGALTVTP